MPKTSQKRRRTIAEAVYPIPVEFSQIAKAWREDVATGLLDLVWSAYDLLKSEILAALDVSKADADLEREITQLLEPRIRQLMTGDEPYFVQHGPYERESRQPPPAQPPQYDIGFVLNANPRIIWPLEAKLLRTSSKTSEYVNEVKANYLRCRYAPFSAEAAMLGYLVQGNSELAFRRIASGLRRKLEANSAFPGRAHKVSCHNRRVPKGKSYPSYFKCHHMVLMLRQI